MNPGIPLGLTAAACFGVGDYVARGLTRTHGWRRALLAVQFASLPLLVIVGLLVEGPPMLSADWTRVAAYAVLNTVGAIGLYRAFERGVLSVVSPIASAFGAVTAGIAIARGQVPSIAVLAGLALTTGGIAAACVAPADDSGRERPLAAGAGWAVLAALALGASFYGLGEVGPRVGATWAVAGYRLVAIPLLWWTPGGVGEDERPPPRSPVGLALGIAALDSGGMIAYAIGSASGDVATVAVLASLFSAVTLLLAQVGLRERLATWQWAGVAAILVGVALITARS